MKKEKTTYGTAYAELQEILGALEGGDVDVDDLSAKVKRAAELIGFCQERLRSTETDVKRVVDVLQKQLKSQTDLPTLEA